MMNHTEQAEAFEQVLLSHTDMCYSVALALTRNPDRAQDLTRNVLTSAWHERGGEDGEKQIKKKLLIALRKTFLKDYREPPSRVEKDALRGENIACFAQEV
jgi:DNA-directed RNA polymerase specialized sigma24 family protein